MSHYQLGQEVVLTAEHRGYPKGTKGLYLWNVMDGGHCVPLLVIPDEQYEKILKNWGLYSLKQLVADLDEMNNRDSIEMRLTTIKPYMTGILSLKDAQESLKAAETMLKKAKEELALFD